MRLGLSTGSKVFVVVLVALFGAALFGIDRFNARTADPSDQVEAGQPVVVQVAPGATARDIAAQLAEQGVVDSERSLRALLADEDRARSIQAGRYQLLTGMGASAALDRLLAGPEGPEAFRVTIPEGLTVEQTLERLAEAEGSPFEVEELEAALDEVQLPEWVPDADELPDGANRLEGMLFPLTYDFRVDADAADVLQQLVDQTDEIVGDLQTPTGGGPYEVLIVASLVERETRVPEEREEVAAVIYNRLEAPMRLQVDATVLYALGQTGADSVTFEDLETESPWNTYTNDGLPPTPISASGRAAIEAAVDPADTDHRFYVVCNLEEGRHVFESSNDAHNANVARFRQLREGEIDPFCPSDA